MFKHTLSIMLLGLALSWTVEAAPRAYGPVKNQDTLWTIAEQLRPDNKATVQQTMLAIYHKNPQAFAGNNINSLMKGVVLKVPSYAETRRYQRLAALREARKHNHFWKRGIDLPRTTPPPIPKLKESRSQKRPKPVLVKTTKITRYAAIPRNTSRRLARLQAQLQVVEARNQQLTTELKALQAKQAKGKPNPALDAQVKKLKIELQELTSVLDQKDNHIKTLQASLKNASETIKAQHADNMRLYDKLKEVSPSSVPATPSSEGKSELKLSSVEAATAAVTAIAAAKATTDGIVQEANSTNATQPAENKAEGKTEANKGTGTTETKDAANQTVWADEQKPASPTQETKSETSSSNNKASELNVADNNTNKPNTEAGTPKTNEPQTLAAALPSTSPSTAKAEDSVEKPSSETANLAATTSKSENDKTANKPANETIKTETSSTQKTDTKTENNTLSDAAKANPEKSDTVNAKPETKLADNNRLEANLSPNDDNTPKTTEGNTTNTADAGGLASKSPTTASSENSAIKAPSQNQASKSEPTNDVKQSSSVPVSQMLAQSGNQASSSTAKSGTPALRGVSPLALAVALISLLFILALVWRAFVQQREMRRLEQEEARVAERMRKRLEDNQSSVPTSAVLVEKKDTDSEPNTEIKF